MTTFTLTTNSNLIQGVVQNAGCPSACRLGGIAGAAGSPQRGGQQERVRRLAVGEKEQQSRTWQEGALRSQWRIGQRWVQGATSAKLLRRDGVELRGGGGVQ
ncbi:hypothetical protein TRIUR3_03912 [Triticum urartu]|uniref:Uncharacterized protein n=1 Tax=Triticum urartu TaxID=4572 RepID=M7YEA3_TRIUA|nr:hypothetical protein TRIUR3_03912 [Triticum urartu]